MIKQGNFECEILCHSIGPNGKDIVTFRHIHERFIHAEFMTHRIARCASSSRAIPYERMKKWIKEDPAKPLFWGKNQKGMVVGEEVKNPKNAESFWLKALGAIEQYADDLYFIEDVHKEICNRLMEPWGWINVLSSWTQPYLDNLFSLRIDRGAHTSMQRLAVNMARLYRDSKPEPLERGQWHLPYVTPEEKQNYSEVDCLKFSVARCRRVSYRTIEDNALPDPDKDRERHDETIRLGHMTPCEHQGCASDDPNLVSGCFVGFVQYRKLIKNEVRKFDYSILDREYKDREYIV